MVSRAALALLVALVGCVRGDYQCRFDSDCNLGEAGRCEPDQRCTQFDPVCPTLRAYSDLSGVASNTCFDDHVAPLDRCAAGQPPAVEDACTTSVCATLPTCCTVGWSEACVQQAQLQCSDLTCDTRIAITATKGSKTELWDLRWDGAAWSAKLDPRRNVLAWLAPLAGATEPRLAGFDHDALVLQDLELAVTPGHNYFEATPVDFDRDGRPTVVLAYTEGSATRLEVLKLDDGSTRPIVTTAATRLSWGVVDGDVFPDAIAGVGASSRYNLLSSVDDADHLRAIDDRVSSTMVGGTTSNPPAVRSFDWIDFDGDRALDVVAFGYSVDVHLSRSNAISTNTLIRIDCDPLGPSNAPGCDGMNQNEQAFAGAALAGVTPALIVATHPKRALYRVEVKTSPTSAVLYRYSFPEQACGATCPPIIAVVTRDLDGDHALDVIAIDADLQIYTALAKDSLDLGALALRPAIQLPTTTTGFVAVRTSVTGAPR